MQWEEYLQMLYQNNDDGTDLMPEDMLAISETGVWRGIGWKAIKNII